MPIQSTFWFAGALLCAASALLLGRSVAFAAEWSFEPKFEVRGQYNDNLTLTTLPHSAVWAGWLNPSLRAQYATEILSVQVYPEFEYVQYVGEEQSDDETFVNFFVPIVGSYRTETDRLGLNAALNRDNALTNELQETGVVTAFVQRQTANIRGSWDRLISERLILQTSYEYYNVKYENGFDSRLFDFHTHTGTFGPSYDWTERTRLFSTAWYSNTKFEDIGFTTQSSGLELGLEFQPFEQWTATASGGGRYVKTRREFGRQTLKDSNLVWVFSFALGHEWERTNSRIGYSRSLNPSGTGVLLETDRINLNIQHRWTETISFSLSGDLIFNDRVGSSLGDNRVIKQRYWQVTPALSWRITEYWTCRLSYGRAERDIESTGNGRAVSNAVNLRVTYTWPQWSMSR